MNESELATHTGLSRETINREMRKLIAEDLVSASRQGILIKDLAKLQARLI
jgi:DNA-binding GntR family transcriptional regulator